MLSLEGQKLLVLVEADDDDEKAFAGCDIDGCELASKAVKAAMRWQRFDRGDTILKVCLQRCILCCRTLFL